MHKLLNNLVHVFDDKHIGTSNTPRDCLSSDKSITSILPFIARDGFSHELLTDNAAYFVMSRKEIKATLIEKDSKSLRIVTTNHDMD